MKKLVCAVLLLACSGWAWGQLPGHKRALSGQERVADSLAQLQLVAYNQRDIEAFLAPYSDSVAVFQFPNKLRYTGKDAMRSRYTRLFERYPELHCKLTHREVLGRTVIDSEELSGIRADSIVRAVAIYTIVRGKIQQVHFLPRE